MITEKRIYRLITVLVGLVVLMLITAIARNIIGFNAVTVALLYLLVVLVTSALADLTCGIVIALVSGLLVNYNFLPPLGTFYIEASEDWVSFGAYTITSIVVSHFAATVRRRAVEADNLQLQILRLSGFTEGLLAVPREYLTLEILAAELRRAFELGYCAIYLFGKTLTANPVSSGTRPSHSLQKCSVANSPNNFLDVITEEGSDVQCLTLKDQGQSIGALVISKVLLSCEVKNEIAVIVSLIIKQSTLIRDAG
ncbi:MAG: DUF4118 domain-containing protein [Kiritimatiellae bacterium]|nr:DUF4118 domain-containing protein [Kiritimatiellia bacterium]MDD5519432.1 DUF4118 domain-containing protein [Kiritimatiellia bacterium]